MYILDFFEKFGNGKTGYKNGEFCLSLLMRIKILSNILTVLEQGKNINYEELYKKCCNTIVIVSLLRIDILSFDNYLSKKQINMLDTETLETISTIKKLTNNLSQKVYNDLHDNEVYSSSLEDLLEDSD